MACSSAGIIASGSFLSQTGDVASTVISTPSASGLYRINYAGEFTAGTGVGVFVSVEWVNDSGTFTQRVGEFFSNDAGHANTTNSFCFYALGGNDISISTDFGGASSSYNLYYSLEAL